MNPIHVNHSGEWSGEAGNEDHDLRMAERDHQQRDASIRTEAYRQALSEVAGELYLHVYSKALAESMARQRKQWETGTDTAH